MKDYYEHIDDYLKGKLSDEDAKLMSSAIKSDKDLMEAVNNHDIAMLILDGAIEDEVRSTITEFDTHTVSSDQEEFPSNKGLSKWVKFFLIIGVFGIIGYLVWNDGKNDKKEERYALIMNDYYDIPINSGTRSKLNSTTTLDSAIYYFDLRDMKFSLELLSKLDSHNDKSIYYLANIYFISKDWKRLNNLLSNLKSSSKYYKELILLGFYQAYLNDSREEQSNYLQKLTISQKEKIDELLMD